MNPKTGGVKIEYFLLYFLSTPHAGMHFFPSISTNSKTILHKILSSPFDHKILSFILRYSNTTQTHINFIALLKHTTGLVFYHLKSRLILWSSWAPPFPRPFSNEVCKCGVCLNSWMWDLYAVRRVLHS